MRPFLFPYVFPQEEKIAALVAKKRKLQCKMHH